MSQPANTRPPAPAAPALNAGPNGGQGGERRRSARATIPAAIDLEVESGEANRGQRILIYGTGGIGKTWLAAHLPSPLFLDLQDGTAAFPVSRIRKDKLTSWTNLRGAIAGLTKGKIPEARSIVIDTMSEIEDLAKQHVLDSKTTEKGVYPESIEGYGWGKGWQFVFDEIEALLADLDRLIDARNVNVCLIAHDFASPVPNPGGEDFIRWEPLLYDGDKRGRGSVRARVKGWVDHMLYVGYDIHAKDGKAVGGGSRTIYTFETATHVAKSRRDQFAMLYDREKAAEVWSRLGIVQG